LNTALYKVSCKTRALPDFQSGRSQILPDLECLAKIDFSNPTKLSSSGGIFAGAGFGKSAGFWPEPTSGTALGKTVLCVWKF